MFTKKAQLKFWHILVLIGFLFLILLVSFLMSDLTIRNIEDFELGSLENRVIYLGEGEICGISNSECSPSFVCQRSEGFANTGGVCVRAAGAGPYQINPIKPDFNNESYNNWDESDFE